ncbi:MAG: tetratricopeptide repeat protein [Chromatiales bacterium]|nr:tetratricopeptide repeat protein [Chromatiales bacterium]
MASHYETEEEQVEAIKKWWRENGKSLIAGVVLGLLGIYGWNAYQSNEQRKIAEASLTYSQLEEAARTGDDKTVAEYAQALAGDAAEGGYAYFAELMRATLQVQKAGPAAAESALQLALDRAPDAGLSHVARLRLARVKIDLGKLDEAAALLDAGAPAGAFEAEYHRIRGDIAVARGDIQLAATEYRAALDKGTGAAALVRMQLADLGLGND